MHNPFQVRTVQISILTLLSVFLAGSAVGLLKARIIPEILDIHPLWWLFIAIVFLIKPVIRYIHRP